MTKKDGGFGSVQVFRTLESNSKNPSKKTVRGVYKIDVELLEKWSQNATGYARFLSFYRNVQNKHVFELTKRQLEWIERVAWHLINPEKYEPKPVKRYQPKMGGR